MNGYNSQSFDSRGGVEMGDHQQSSSTYWPEYEEMQRSQANDMHHQQQLQLQKQRQQQHQQQLQVQQYFQQQRQRQQQQQQQIHQQQQNQDAPPVPNTISPSIKDDSSMPPPTSSPPNQRQQQHSPAREWDMRKLLHLYMHDYCLKQNYIKAANALANDTGVRTDEGVPIGGDIAEGLLTQMFSAFWDNYVNLNKLTPKHQGESLPGQISSEQASSSSSTARKPESEPLRRSASDAGLDATKSNQLRLVKLGGGSITPGPHSANAEKAAQFWGGEGTKGQQPSPQQQLNQSGLGKLSSQDAAAMMQKLGWGGRPIEALNVDEKSKLANALKRSQAAQQQALQRMAQTHQNNFVEVTGSGSGNRGFNGSAFQQTPTLSQPPQQTFQQVSPGGQAGGVSPQPLNKKSPGGQANQRKKRRSSINMQAIAQLQQQQSQQSQHQQGNGGTSSKKGAAPNSLGLAPSPMMNTSTITSAPLSPAEAARNLEEQQIMARRLQAQSQGIIGQSPGSSAMSMSRSNGSKTGATPPSNSLLAQSEAATQATAQLNAQIVQMQAQLNRQNPSKNGGQVNSNQISQLKIMQGKMNQNARGSENDWARQQQQQHNQQQHSQQQLSQQQHSQQQLNQQQQQQQHPHHLHHHHHQQQQQQAMGRQQNQHPGDMGPPPSPNSSGFYNQHLDPSLGGFPPVNHGNNNVSNPPTPVLTTSASSSTILSTPELRDGLHNLLQESPNIQFRDNVFGFPHQTPPPSASSDHFVSQGPPNYSKKQSQYGDSLASNNQGRYQAVEPSLMQVDEANNHHHSFGGIDFANFDWSNVGSAQ